MGRSNTSLDEITSVTQNKLNLKLTVCSLYALFVGGGVLFSNTLSVYSSKWLLSLQLPFLDFILYITFTTSLLYILVTRCVNKLPLISKQEYAKERVYRDIFTHSPDAQLIYHRDDFSVVEANHSACELLNFNPQSEAENSIRAVFGDSVSTNHLMNWLSQSSERQSGELSIDVTKNDDSKIQLNLVQYNIGKGRQLFGLLVIRDISQVRRYIRDVEHAAKRVDIAREISGMGCWEIDLTYEQVYCCTNVCELLDLASPSNTPIPLKQFEALDNARIFCEIAEALTFSEEQQMRVEHEFIDHHQQVRNILIQANYNTSGETNSIIGTMLDQTTRRQSEKKLRQQQAQWTNLVETLPEGIGIVQEQHLVYVNQAVLNMLGARELHEVTRRSVFDFVDAQELDNVRHRMAKVFRQADFNEGFVHRKLQRVNGEPFEAEIAGRLITYESKPAIQLVIRDLTESLKAQEALSSANRRLASLSSKTLHMLESERKRIAGELHDDVGQSLTAIKLMTRWLTRRLEDEALHAKAQDIQQICANTLDTVRNLSLMLRPAQLDSLGLAAAIEWQADKLFSDAAMEFTLDAGEFREIEDKDTEIIAFRVLQESLTNIARHAQANTVQVYLQTKMTSFCFTVLDNGVGFDVKEQRLSTGLVNMKERVELANGEIHIHSLPGVGTEISVSLPMQPSLENTQERENETE